MAKIGEEKLQEIFSCIDEESGELYLYIPYLKNDGNDLDYLEVVMTSNGPSINVAGFNKDPQKTTRFKIVNAGFKTVDEKQHLSFEVKNKSTSSIITLPIVVEDNPVFMEYFRNLTANKLDNLTEVKKANLPKFSVIDKDLPEKEKEPTPEDSDRTPDNNHEEKTIKTEIIGPQKIDGNLVYKNDALSYVFLPYKFNDNDSHLTLMQYDGKTYINIKGLDETNKDKNTTCQVLAASFEKVEEKEVLALSLEVNGQMRVVNMPIPKTGNEKLLSDLNSVISNSHFAFTNIEVYDCPRVSNPPFNKELNIEKPKTSNPLEDQKLIQAKRKGQKLQEQTIAIGKESINGLSQEINSEKLGLKNAQKLTLIDSSSYKGGDSSVLKNVLLMVSTDSNPKPIAVFSKDIVKQDDKDVPVVKFKVSKPFLDEFLARPENKNLELPEGKLDGEYVTYEIEKLKLSQDLNIQDMQIRGASPDFAILFSALGLQIVDKNKHLGILRNKENAFNIGVSTEFLSRSMKKEEEKDDADKKISYDKQGVGFDSLLIARIQLERKKSAEPNKIISLSLPEGSTTPTTKLYSIPLTMKGKDGTESQQYLNIRTDSTGKSYAYLHITGEGVKSAKIPKFYEIDIAHLEESSTSTMSDIKNPSLYLGLKDGKDVVRVNIDLDYQKNAETLKALKKTVLAPEFERKIHDEEVAEPLFKGKQRNIDGENFVIYPIPKENSANILSLSDTAILSRKVGETESESEGNLPKSPILPDHPIVDRTNTTIIEKTNNENKKVAPIITGDLEQEPEEEPINPIQWKEKLEKPKSPKKHGVRNVLIGLFALCTFLSMVLPFLAIGAIIFAAAAVGNEVRPWIVSIANDRKKKREQKQRSFKPGRDKVKTKENQLSKSVEKLSALREKNDILNRQKQKILDNEKITEKKRSRLIKEIDDKINKNKKEISKLQITIENEGKDVSIAKTENLIKDYQQSIKYLKNHDKEMSKIDKANISELEKTLAQQKKEYDIAVAKKEEIKKDKAELETLENLEKAEKSGTLTGEQLELLKKLRAKFKKKGRKKYSEYDKEISDAVTEITRIQEKNEALKGVIEAKESIAKSNALERKQEIEKSEAEVERIRESSTQIKKTIKESNKNKKSVTGNEAILEDYDPIGWDIKEADEKTPPLDSKDSKKKAEKSKEGKADFEK